MNRTTIMGYLGAEPEERFTEQGQKLIRLRIADSQWKKGGTETIWWNATYWGDHPLIKHMKKGSAVIVTGEVEPPRVYTDREGQPRSSADLRVSDISFSPFGKKEEGASAGGSMSAGLDTESSFGSFGAEAGTAPAAAGAVADSDVPF